MTAVRPDHLQISLVAGSDSKEKQSAVPREKLHVRELSAISPKMNLKAHAEARHSELGVVKRLTFAH